MDPVLIESSISPALPPQSVCAHCSIPLSKDFGFKPYVLQDGTSLNVIQGLQLVFLRRPPEKQHRQCNLIKFCDSCDSSFESLLHLFINFIRTAAKDSFVLKLVPTLKYMRQKSNNLRTDANEDSFVRKLIPSLESVPMRSNDLKNLQSLEVKVECVSDPDSPNIILPEVNPVNESSSATTCQSELLIRRSMRITHERKQSHTSVVGEGDYTDDRSDESPTKSQEVEAKPEPGLNCPKPRKARTERRRHALSSKLYSCIICKQKFNNQLQLRRHESNHTGARPFKCTQCDANFVTRPGLNLHARRAHPDATGKKYKSLYRKKHKTRRPLPPVEVGDAALLKTDQYKCAETDCAAQDISFATLREWVLHHEQVHGETMGYGNVEPIPAVIAYDGQWRPCPHCGKKYKSNTPLIAHIKVIHLQLNEFQCSECNLGLGSKQTLTQHMLLKHSTEQPVFLCSLCGASFNKKGTLVMHEKVHLDLDLDSKRFPCSVCDKAFERRYRLDKHMVTAHTDTRNFVCNICGHDFKLLSQLNHHKRKSHEKNPDQVCSYCGKSYRFKENLKTHLMQVHKLDNEQARDEAKVKPARLFRVLPNGDRVYKENPNLKPNTTCPICNRTYVRRKQLYLHLISVHNHTEEESRNLTKFESKPEWSSLQKNKRRKSNDEEDDEGSDFSLMQL